MKKISVVLLGIIGGILILFNGGTEKQQQLTTEQHLANILAQIEGVGKLAVFIYEPDEKEQTMQLFFENSGKSKSIAGVLIVCEGAKSIAVQQQLKEIIYNLLQVPFHRIVIEEMKVEERGV